MFVSYTSGSTGKPKGIVHVHGGYTYGVALSMRAVFGAERGADVILTLGTTGWITGMSYMLVGPLVCGVHAVLLEGSFAYPDALRFARACADHKVRRRPRRRSPHPPRSLDLLGTIKRSSFGSLVRMARDGAQRAVARVGNPPPSRVPITTRSAIPSRRSACSSHSRRSAC